MDAFPPPANFVPPTPYYDSDQAQWEPPPWPHPGSDQSQLPPQPPPQETDSPAPLPNSAATPEPDESTASKIDRVAETSVFAIFVSLLVLREL